VADASPRPALRAALSLAVLGVVFGDIGTSPIYTFRECLRSAGGTAGSEVVLGLLSLVLWALAIVVAMKYVLLVMRADNDGEGGIMALLALAARSIPDPRRRAPLVLVGLAGASLFFGDGMITPAISVLSAVEGLRVAEPGLAPFVLPVASLVLVTLFAVQRFGTERIGRWFGPVMALWFAVIAAGGAWQIVHRPEVLAAVDPRHAAAFLRSHGAIGFFALGSVFLALTGAEALYADMGHFGRQPIRADWFALVLPALALNYLGQGALVLGEPETVRDPFFRMFPSWSLYPLVLLATMATVIAAQAVISGAFALSQQAMHLGLLPSLEVRQMSAEKAGQVYVPQVNWILMLCVLGLVFAFGSSGALASAYGIAVSGTMLITTTLLSVVARRTWKWNIARILLVVGFFFLVDLAFVAANAVKIPQGGWFPLLVAGLMFAVMSTWRRARQILTKSVGDSATEPNEFIEALDKAALAHVPGTAVYLAPRRNAIPPALAENVRHNKVLHQHVVLLTVVTERVPHVGESERLRVERLDDRFVRVTLRFGFAEPPDVPAALAGQPDLHAIDVATASYFLGREIQVAPLASGLRPWRARLYAFLSRNAESPGAYFHIPARQIVALGAQLEVVQRDHVELTAGE
jgi:KUP system potassium uptake protein